MFDADVVDLCRNCLLDAVLATTSEEDLSLVATALSRDLFDAHPTSARELLVAAARGAMSVLDASDLGASAFAVAASRLAWLQRRAARGLAAPAPAAG